VIQLSFKILEGTGRRFTGSAHWNASDGTEWHYSSCHHLCSNAHWSLPDARVFGYSVTDYWTGMHSPSCRWL